MIGIVGYGVVGRAVKSLFENYHEVIAYDPEYQFSKTRHEINKCDVVFVCVPTPTVDGKPDTSIVEETIEWLDVPLIIVKSTMLPPRSFDNIVFSPEIMGESKYWSPYKFDNDMAELPFYVFGGPRSLTKKAVDLYAERLGPKKIYIQTDARTAMLAKYAWNTFYATKITYMNELFDICDKLGVDFYELREIMGHDPRFETMHTMVFKENRGFSGKCFPKDLEALIHHSREYGHDPHLLEEVKRSNNRFRGSDEGGD